jgi:hypothetical protein
MKARRSEVSVNQKNATVGLADNGLCEICSDKRLAFCGITAGNNDALQHARISNLRQPRSESSKRLGPDFLAVGVSEHAHARIQCPFRMGAPLQELLEPEESLFVRFSTPVFWSCVQSIPCLG